jgi:hypothetical protein
MAEVRKIKGQGDTTVLILDEIEVSTLIYCLDSEIERDLHDGSLEPEGIKFHETIQSEAQKVRGLL